MLKQEAFDFFEREKANFLMTARAEATTIYLRQGFVTTDDIRKELPPPRGCPNIMGAIFQRNLWEVIGFEISKRPSSHGRRILKYRPREIF